MINAIWQVPGPKSASGFANWVSNGWQLGVIYKASDGVPFTPTVGTDGDPLGKGNDSGHFGQFGHEGESKLPEAYCRHSCRRRR